VHGDKSAYLKLAMALLDFLEPKWIRTTPACRAGSEEGRPVLDLTAALPRRNSCEDGTIVRTARRTDRTGDSATDPGPPTRPTLGTSAAPAATAAAAASERAALC